MKIGYAGLILLSGCLLCSCKKARQDINDYFPKVETKSASITSNGDVIVTGKVALTTDTILAAGFCVGTSSVPNMTLNQVVFNMPSLETFTTQFNNHLFDREKTYYFTTWAINKYGYKYGNTIELANIKGSYSPPPCKLDLGFIDLGQGAGNIPLDTAFMGSANHRVILGFEGKKNMSFYFNTKPITGVYDNSGLNSSDPRYVSIGLSGSTFSTSTSTNVDGIVYVQELSDTTLELAMCEGIYKKTYKLKTYFVVKYE
jgi:hypothetical protein